MKYKIGDWIKLKPSRNWNLNECIIVGRNRNKFLITNYDMFGRIEISASDIECKYERK